MRLYGPFGGPQFGGHLLVQQTGSDQRKDLAFARGQRALQLFKFYELQSLSAALARKMGASSD